MSEKLNIKEQEIIMKPIKDLDKEIQKVLDKESGNFHLLRELNEEFAKKGMNLKNISALFNENKTVEEMDDMEKIAFSNACKVTFEKEGKDWYRDFEVERYFSNKSILNYLTFVNSKPIVDEVFFKNAVKIDNYNYRCIATGKQVYDYINNMLWLYNKTTQRAGKLKKIGDKYTRSISLNKKAVREIADSVLDGTFEESEIILNLRKIKGKKQQFVFKEGKIENIGDITIVPEYNVNSEHLTFLEIIDGYHRLSGIKMAMEEHYQKTNEWLECKIGVKLVIADMNRALRIISQTFKRTDTNRDWLKAIEKTDTTIFVDDIIKNSKMLKGNVENTFEECQAFNGRTYKTVLIDSVKKLEIPVDDIVESSFCSSGIAKNIDLIVSFVDKKIKEDSKYKFLNYCNMYIVYTRYAYMLYISEYSDTEVIIKCKELIDFLSQLGDEMASEYKLNLKNFNFNNIFNLISEVE